MLNIKKLENQLAEKKITKAKLCSKLRIARSTLDSILNGADSKISTIEAIANELGITMGFLFDDEITIEKKEFQATGEKSLLADHIDKVDMRDQRKLPATTNTSSKGKPTYDELEAKVIDLQGKLLEAQAKIIKLVEKENLRN